jgi:hypothetical protein
MIWKLQQRPYAKRVGLPGDVELYFDAGSHGSQQFLFSFMRL